MRCEGIKHVYPPKERVCYCSRQHTPEARFKHMPSKTPKNHFNARKLYKAAKSQTVEGVSAHSN